MASQAVSRLIEVGLQRLEHEAAYRRRSPLVAATALLALEDVPNTGRVRQALAGELQKTLSRHWLHDRDLLSVFLVLSALHSYNPGYVSGAVLAAALQRLVACEVEPGGPYASAPGVIEPAANAAIAQFLRRQQVVLPQLEQYLSRLIDNSEYDTQTLHGDGLILLLIGGTPPDNQRRLLKDVLAMTGDTTTMQEYAVQLAVILALGGRSHWRKLLANLVLSVEESNWQAEAFYNDMLQLQPDDLLTTALVLQALHAGSVAASRQVTSKELQQHREIYTLAHEAYSSLSEPLRTNALEVVGRIASMDNDFEISLLARFFVEQLHVRQPERHLIAKLGAANVHNWLATIIYDDFIDEEGVPALLPIANVAHRLSLNLYDQIASHDSLLRQYVDALYVRVDQANAWELQYARATVDSGSIKLPALPDYNDQQVLADRALGHVTGVLLLLKMLPEVNDEAFSCLEQSLCHFLIARQLNDDLHDWRKDLSVGQLSAVVTDLLQVAHLREGYYTLDVLITKLELEFWNIGLQNVCSQIREHTAMCRRLLSQSGLAVPDFDQRQFMKLIANIESSANDALLLQANQAEFLHAFKH